MMRVGKWLISFITSPVLFAVLVGGIVVGTILVDILTGADIVIVAGIISLLVAYYVKYLR